MYVQLLCTSSGRDANIALSIQAVIGTQYSSIVVVVGDTSLTLNGPILCSFSLLHDSAGRRSAADVVVGGKSR